MLAQPVQRLADRLSRLEPGEVLVHAPGDGIIQIDGWNHCHARESSKASGDCNVAVTPSFCPEGERIAGTSEPPRRNSASKRLVLSRGLLLYGFSPHIRTFSRPLNPEAALSDLAAIESF